MERTPLAFDSSFDTDRSGPCSISIKFRPNPSKLSSRTTADLHQPPFRATAAVCRRPLGRRTDLNGRTLTILEHFWPPKLLGPEKYYYKESPSTANKKMNPITPESTLMRALTSGVINRCKSNRLAATWRAQIRTSAEGIFSRVTAGTCHTIGLLISGIDLRRPCKRPVNAYSLTKYFVMGERTDVYRR